MHTQAVRGEECFDGTAGSPGTGLNLKLLQVAFILSEKHDIESHSICSISTCTFTRIEVKGEKTCFGLRLLHQIITNHKSSTNSLQVLLVGSGQFFLFFPKQCGHTGVLMVSVKARCSVVVVSSVSGQFPVNSAQNGSCEVKCPCAFWLRGLALNEKSRTDILPRDFL